MRPLKSRVCLCPVCGHTSDIVYYTAPDKGTGAKLMKTIGGYYLRADPPAKEDDPEVSIKLKNPDLKVSAKGIPDELRANYRKGKDGAQEVSMTRSCPMCRTRTVFHSCLGKVPLYVIAAIGAPSAGKSAWLGALSGDALAGVNKQPYPYRITPCVLVNALEAGGSTSEESQGMSNFFEIIDKTSGEVVALIFIMDTAGENYRHQKLEKNGNLSRLLKGDGVHYEGISGAVILDPAVKIEDFEASADPAKSDEEKLDAVKIYNSLRKTLQGLPVAYIRTFADLLIEQEAGRERDPGELPLISKDTFINMGDPKVDPTVLSELFTPEQIRSRIALQNEIASSVRLKSTVFSMIDSSRTCGFMVQSCVKSDNGAKKNNYSQQFNVVDPLLWLLDQFGIFPSISKEGS